MQKTVLLVRTYTVLPAGLPQVQRGVSVEGVDVALSASLATSFGGHI